MLEHTIGEIAVLAVWVAGAGILVGILADLFGIGGGAIIVPVLYEVFRELGVRDIPDLCVAEISRQPVPGGGHPAPPLRGTAHA